MSSKKVRVFIAEDSPHVLDALKAMIAELEGVELIGHADDAETAAEQIRSIGPDVAILDIRLASGSGLDVLRGIKREGQAGPLTIIFTSHAEARLQQICMKLGADYVLNKADDGERLANLLRSLLNPPSSTPPDDSKGSSDDAEESS